MPAPFIRLLASPRSHDFIGIISRSAHARNAYPGFSCRLWWSSRIHRTLVTSLTLDLLIHFLFHKFLEKNDFNNFPETGSGGIWA